MVKSLIKGAMFCMLLVIIKLTADVVFCSQIGQLDTVHIRMGSSITRSESNQKASGGVKAAGAWYDPSTNEVVIGDAESFIDGTLTHECVHAWDSNHSTPAPNSRKEYYTKYSYDTLTNFWSGSEDVSLKELKAMCLYGKQNSTEFLACSVQFSYNNAMTEAFYAATNTGWYRVVGYMLVPSAVAFSVAVGLLLSALWITVSIAVKSYFLNRKYGIATTKESVTELALAAMRIGKEVIMIMEDGEVVGGMVCTLNTLTGDVCLSNKSGSQYYVSTKIWSLRFK